MRLLFYFFVWLAALLFLVFFPTEAYPERLSELFPVFGKIFALAVSLYFIARVFTWLGHSEEGPSVPMQIWYSILMAVLSTTLFSHIFWGPGIKYARPTISLKTPMITPKGVIHKTDRVWRAELPDQHLTGAFKGQVQVGIVGSDYKAGVPRRLTFDYALVSFTDLQKAFPCEQHDMKHFVEVRISDKLGKFNSGAQFVLEVKERVQRAITYLATFGIKAKLSGLSLIN